MRQQKTALVFIMTAMLAAPTIAQQELKPHFLGASTIPLGLILPYAGQAHPADLKALQQQGWFLCDGSEVSRKLPLFAVIGDIYGRGDAVKTFNLPDCRGRFLRGVDDPTGACAAGRDPDVALRTGVNGGFSGPQVGSVQEDALKVHTHTLSILNTDKDDKHGFISLNDSQRIVSATTSPAGSSTESRPKNIYVNWIVFAGTTGNVGDLAVKPSQCSGH